MALLIAAVAGRVVGLRRNELILVEGSTGAPIGPAEGSQIGGAESSRACAETRGAEAGRIADRGAAKAGRQRGPAIASANGGSAEDRSADVVVHAAEVGGGDMAVPGARRADAQLVLCRLLGIRAEIAVMALLIATVAGGVIRLRRNELVLILAEGRHPRAGKTSVEIIKG